MRGIHRVRHLDDPLGVAVGRLPVEVLPGPSAAITALVASGLRRRGLGKVSPIGPDGY